jgi:hypothetical protein
LSSSGEYIPRKCRLDQLIKNEEVLARYILYDKWIRKVDNTPKPDAFIPPSDLNLSVTRHIGLSEKDLWKIGQTVADIVSKKRPDAKLEGRADLLVVVARNQALQVHSYPISGNANHAHITGWPKDKPAQKSIAQELAAAAHFTLYKYPVHSQI